jgi:hypothetical protein
MQLKNIKGEHMKNLILKTIVATALGSNAFAGGSQVGSAEVNSEKQALAIIQAELKDAVLNSKAQALLPYEVTDYVLGNMGLSEKQRFGRENNALGGASNAKGGPTSLLLLGGRRDHEFNFGKENSISANIEAAIQNRKIDLGTANFLRENWVKPLLQEREDSLAKKQNAMPISDREGLKDTVQNLNRISDMLISYIRSEQNIQGNSYSAVKRIVNPKHDSNSNTRVQTFLEANLMTGDENTGLVDKILIKSYGIKASSDKKSHSDFAKENSLALYKEFALPLLQIGLAASDFATFREAYGNIPYLNAKSTLNLPNHKVEMESRMYAIGEKISTNPEILAMILREPLMVAVVGFELHPLQFAKYLSDADKTQVADFKAKNPQVSKLLVEMVEAGIKWDLLVKDSFTLGQSFRDAKDANTKGLLATTKIPNYEQNFKLSSNMCIKGLR